MRASRVRLAIILLGVFVIVAAAVIATSPSTRIRYHRWRMNANWDATFAGPEVKPDGSVGYHLGEAYERYEYHRSALVALGAVRRIDYTFQHILTGSPESSRLSHTFHSGRRPPCIDFTWWYPNSQEPMQVTVWCDPEDVDDWQKFFASQDVEKP